MQPDERNQVLLFALLAFLIIWGGTYLLQTLLCTINTCQVIIQY